MIQWCEDCRFAYGEPTEDLHWCGICANISLPGEIAWGYQTKNPVISTAKEEHKTQEE